MFNALLRPTDGSDQALQAAHHALELARSCQAWLLLGNVASKVITLAKVPVLVVR
jgi:nucleotide-binding universal stress UspA family protein